MSASKLPIDLLVQGYLDYCRDVRKSTDRTLVDMRCSLRRIGREIGIQKSGTELHQLKLKDILHWLQNQRLKNSRASSLCKCISHLRGYLEYAMRIGRIDRNVLDGFVIKDPGVRTPPNVLGLDQARMLIEACGQKTATQRRDRLIILILYGCGLRTAELCNLNVKDVDAERREILVRGKGDLHRMVPVPERVFTELLAYLHKIRRRTGALFKTETKKCRVNSRMVSLLVGEIAKQAGIDQKVTPRTLRHSYATHLMDRGVDLAVISCLMGHRSPSQTGVYLHAPKGRVNEAVQKLTFDNIKGEDQCTGITE